MKEEAAQKLKENTGTAVAIATALELTQVNAMRSESMWGRVGYFALNVVLGLATLTAFDAVWKAFKKKPKKPVEIAENATATDDGLYESHTHKSWAKEVAENKSCGCPFRQN